MKIVLSSTDDNLITEFLRLAKINDVEIIKVKNEIEVNFDLFFK